VIKAMLEDEGLTPDYEPPIERRGAGEIIAFTVVINIASAYSKDVLDAAIKRAIKRYRTEYRFSDRETVEPPEEIGDYESWGSE
jgi:hypothetical protein